MIVTVMSLESKVKIGLMAHNTNCLFFLFTTKGVPSWPDDCRKCVDYITIMALESKFIE